MRVLIVSEHKAPPGQGGGGAESMLRDQTRALVRLGHQVAWWQGDGSIEEAVEQFRPDVVQVMTIHNFLGFACAQWLQSQRVPMLWAVMDYWPFCRGRMLLRRYDEPCQAVTGSCDGDCADGRSPEAWLDVVNRSPVVALNDYTADIYRRNGMRVDAVVELGVDTDAFAPDPAMLPTGAVSVYTSSAWAAFPAKGMRYVQQAIEGSEHSVQLMTGLARDRVAEGLKRAHIYVFPSCYEETWGLCLNEAMASGCAVIASDVAGARAQVHEGTGVLVPPRDAVALREALAMLLADAGRRGQLGQAARTHVEQEHSLDAMGRRWEAVYREVIANG